MKWTTKVGFSFLKSHWDESNHRTTLTLLFLRGPQKLSYLKILITRCHNSYFWLEVGWDGGHGQSSFAVMIRLWIDEKNQINSVGTFEDAVLRNGSEQFLSIKNG